MSSSDREPGAALDLRRARLHFAGIAGSGMSGLAQYQALRGAPVSGSDRDFDRGRRRRVRDALEALGVRIVPQDGSAVVAGCDAVVASAAVESQVPDIAAARRAGLPVVHRAELLARLAAERRVIAVAGSSGKSTVVSLVFELLRAAGRDPSLLNGAELLALRAEGRLGNAWAGGSEWLVMEADESDGSLVRYHPEVGVVLNLHRDHKEPAELLELFGILQAQTRGRCVLGAGRELAPLRRAGDLVFGLAGELEAEAGTGAATLGAAEVELDAGGSRFTVELGTASRPCRLPLPGLHNVRNALAALAAGHAAGLALETMSGALAAVGGVARRFESLGVAAGVEVIDDFAHNPRKIEASLRTAAGRAGPDGRLLAVYQPHGFGPTRFLREGLVKSLADRLRPADRLWLLEIYDAGGTARRDITAAELVADLARLGRKAQLAADRAALVAALAATARPGDLVLVMGARDPSLTDLCRSILAAVAAAAAAAPRAADPRRPGNPRLEG